MFIDRVGQKFGRLTVVARAPGRTSSGSTIWISDCNCGTRGHIVSNGDIKKTKSCGCSRRRGPPSGTKLTQARLKALLHYDPETGAFYWLVANSSCVQIGDRAGGVTGRYGYWSISVDDKRYKSHQLAWFYTYGFFPKELDHINRDPADKSDYEPTGSKPQPKRGKFKNTQR